MKDLLTSEYSFKSQLEDYKIQISSWLNKKYVSESAEKAFTFDSNLWNLKTPYSNNTYFLLEFSFCSNVIYHHYDLILMKCFFTNLLMDGLVHSTIYGYYSILSKIYVGSNGFKNISIMADDEIVNLCTNMNTIYLYMPIKYLEFILENNFIDNSNDYLVKVLSKFNNIYINESVQNNQSREIPSNEEIAMFQYYLHQFETTPQELEIYNLFFPVRIWWHLSIMIPIRPSEITYMLKRNCIYKLNGKCYIRINRIKNGVIKKMLIPIINKLCISEDIYNLISEYQEIISGESSSVSLFSMNYLRNCILILKEKNSYFSNRSNLFYRKYSEYNHFESEDLNQLINIFYDYYIDNHLGDSTNYQRLLAGDTRHLAFSSLLLQNINPIDIAMIGGHTSIQSLSSYVNHVDLYIDSEIYRYYNHMDINKNLHNQKVKDIIMNKSFNAPDHFEDAVSDEYNIGYCMDLLLDCEDDICFFCSKWWCRPKTDHVIKATRILNERILKQLNDEMKYNKSMLNILFKKATVELAGGNMIISEEYYSQYRNLIKNISNTASRREFIKQSIILNFDKGEENE